MKEYLITEDGSKRINAAKVWFTLFVVFVHSYSESVNFTTGPVEFDIPLWLSVFKYVFSIGIAGCAVPGFFLISSVLLYRKPFSWRVNVKKKLKNLMLPYLILNAFWIAVYYIAQKIPAFSVYFSNAGHFIADWDIASWADAFLGFRGTYPMLYPLWFLRDLFVMNLIAPIVKKAVDAAPKIMLALGLIAWCAVYNIPVFCFNIQAISFWVMGCAFVKLGITLELATEKTNPRILGAGCLVFEVFDVLTRNFLWGYVFHRIAVIFILWFVFVSMTHFRTEKMNRFFSRASEYGLGVYFFHEMALTVTKKLSARFLPQTVFVQLAEYILIPFTVIAFAAAVCLAMKKIIPHTYSVITGGRYKKQSTS